MRFSQVSLLGNDVQTNSEVFFQIAERQIWATESIWVSRNSTPSAGAHQLQGQQFHMTQQTTSKSVCWDCHEPTDLRGNMQMLCNAQWNLSPKKSYRGTCRHVLWIWCIHCSCCPSPVCQRLCCSPLWLLVAPGQIDLLTSRAPWCREMQECPSITTEYPRQNTAQDWYHQEEQGKRQGRKASSLGNLQVEGHNQKTENQAKTAPIPFSAVPAVF